MSARLFTVRIRCAGCGNELHRIEGFTPQEFTQLAGQPPLQVRDCPDGCDPVARDGSAHVRVDWFEQLAGGRLDPVPGDEVRRAA